MLVKQQGSCAMHMCQSCTRKSHPREEVSRTCNTTARSSMQRFAYHNKCCTCARSETFVTSTTSVQQQQCALGELDSLKGVTLPSCRRAEPSRQVLVIRRRKGLGVRSLGRGAYRGLAQPSPHSCTWWTLNIRNLQQQAQKLRCVAS